MSEVYESGMDLNVSIDNDVDSRMEIAEVDGESTGMADVEMSDTEIDEVLGIENTEHDGLWNSMTGDEGDGEEDRIEGEDWDQRRRRRRQRDRKPEKERYEHGEDDDQEDDGGREVSVDVGSDGERFFNKYMVPSGEAAFGAVRYVAEQNMPEGTAQEGLWEAWMSTPVYIMGMLARSGASSVYAMIDCDDKTMARLGELCDGLISQGVLRGEDLRGELKNLEKALSGVSAADRWEIVRNREKLSEKYEVRELILGEMGAKPGLFSEEEREFVRSTEFFQSGKVGMHAEICQKFFDERGVRFSKPIRAMNCREIDSLVPNERRHFKGLKEVGVGSKRSEAVWGFKCSESEDEDRGNMPVDGAKPGVPVNEFKSGVMMDGFGCSVSVDGDARSEGVDGTKGSVTEDGAKRSALGERAKRSEPVKGAKRGVPVDGDVRSEAVEGFKRSMSGGESRRGSFGSTVLSEADKALLKDLRKRVKKKEAARNRYLGWAGAGRIVRNMGIVGVGFTMRSLAGDENYAQAIRGIRNATIIGGVGIKAVRVSGGLVGKVTGLTYASEMIRSGMVNVARRTIREASAPLRDYLNVRAEKKIQAKTARIIKRFGEGGYGRGLGFVTRGYDAVNLPDRSEGIDGAGAGISRKIAGTREKADAGIKGVRAGIRGFDHRIRGVRLQFVNVNRQGFWGRRRRGSAKPVFAVGRVLETVRSIIGDGSRYLKIAVGLAVILFVGIYVFITALGNMSRVLDEVLEGWGSSGSELVEHFKDGYENVIEYSHYRDMQDDIDMLLEEDEKTYEKAKELGEGHPVNDEVLEGHHINRYGCPDKEKGYTIHYLDPQGNEISSRASNVKDVEALCVAMVANEIGDYKNYKKDLERFDELLLDMYELMVYHDPDTWLPFRYEESEIYTCLYGCDEFDYCCNDAGAYATYEKYKADGCGTYGDLEPYSGEGCETRTVTSYDGLADDESIQDVGESGGDGVISGAGGDGDVGDENGGSSSQKINVNSYGFCPGHSVPICYGHKDVDIYITLYDVEYAIAENIYPEDWAVAKYRQMVREFMRNGQWKSEWYAKIARNYVDGDWYELYGVLVEGAEFNVGELTDEDLEKIKKIIDENGGDISKAREKLIEFGLGYIGKIGYKYGAKAGSGTPKELDCSGFVQWVFREALGKTVPGSTGGYAGYKTKQYKDLKVGDLGFIFVGGSNASTGTYNHVGIYCGKNGAGQDMWLHCSSGGGGVVLNSTGMFKVFVDPFGE